MSRPQSFAGIRKPFDEVVTIGNGLVDPRKTEFRDSLHVGPDNISSENGRIIHPLQTARELGLKSGKFPFEVGDILYSKIRPNLNKVAVADVHGICSADMYVLRPKGVDRSFLFHSLRDEFFYKQAVAASMRSGLPKVNRDDLSMMELKVPPLPEQRRIAAILDSWDNAIATAEKLVRAKRQRRDWLTSELTRTNNHQAMSEVADIVFSTVDKKTSVDEIRVRVCNYLHVLGNRTLTDDLRFDAGSATAQEIGRFSLLPGDVVFTKDSETAEEIAEVSVVTEQLENVVCGYHLAIARPREGVAVGRYVAHALRNPAVRNEFVTRVNGAVRFGLTMETMDQVEIPLPSLETQIRVADILDAADSELATLSRSIDQLRLQKRGLMQKLMSGELPVPESIDRLLPGGQKVDEAIGADEQRAEATG